MRGEPPRLAGAVVDRAAHERMAEAIAARDVGRAGHARRQQLVDRGQRLVVVELGGGGREVEVERVAGDRRAPRQPPGALAQRRDLLLERARHRRRHADASGSASPATRGRRGLARELLEVERVAAALAS